MNAVEGKGQSDQREQHPSDYRGGSQPGNDPQAERVERKESRTRGRQRAEVWPVAIVSDHEIPGRIPTSGGGSEEIAQPTKSPGHPGRGEGGSHGAVAK